MNLQKNGYRTYTGKAYRNIHTLRENGIISDSYRKKSALDANKKLMQELKTITFQIPKGIPYNIRYVFRGDDASLLVRLPNGMLSKNFRSYISFSRDINIAYQFAFKRNIPIIFMLDLKSLSPKIPVIYNGLWKFSSYNPHEKEIVIPPGKIIVHKTPYQYVQPSKSHLSIPVHIVSFVPDKTVTNKKTRSVNPYKK
jgi:hypothetical protein